MHIVPPFKTAGSESSKLPGLSIPRSPTMFWSPAIFALTGLVGSGLGQFVPVPPVLVPSLGDTWQVGDLRTVEWCVHYHYNELTASQAEPIDVGVWRAYSSIMLAASLSPAFSSCHTTADLQRIPLSWQVRTTFCDSGHFIPLIACETDQPLAKGFPISQKIMNVIVPKVPTRKDYRIFRMYSFCPSSYASKC